MKYVMLKIEEKEITRLVPVIFPDFIIHSDISSAVRSVLKKVHNMDSEVHSAGEINLLDCSCYGESSTLKVKSREEDGDVILRYDYFLGII
jgi:hypothetical protein